MEENTQEKKLSGSQKTGFVLLFIFALLTVGLSFLQIRNNIYNPFALKLSQSDVEAMQALQYDENTKLQQIDTDQDGLNDYEEVNFYSTSRYLPDTDSDGVSDKEEIESGTDPLCPKGDICQQDEYSTLNNTSSTIETPISDSIQTPDQIILNSQFGTGLSASTSDQVLDLQAIASDPEALRQLLISTGKVSEEDLQDVDDDTLLQLAQNLINQNNTSVVTTTTAQ